jgi:hypothetical protein
MRMRLHRRSCSVISTCFRRNLVYGEAKTYYHAHLYDLGSHAPMRPVSITIVVRNASTSIV